MASLELDPIEPLANALHILHRFSEKYHFKCSPTSFSIVVSQINKPYCISSSKTLPLRFDSHNSYEVNFRTIDFFAIMSYLDRMGVSSLTFSMPNDQSDITLQYCIPCQENLNTKVLPTSSMVEDDHKNVGQIDYGSFFVSIALEEFQCLVKDLNNAGCVRVTITSTQIKFVPENDQMEIILTTKEGECIIGGIEEGEEIKCGISLYPMEFYKAFTSKRVWFFSSCDANGLLLIAPMGVHTHISSFFPQDISKGGN